MGRGKDGEGGMNDIPERDASSKADRALKLHEQGLTRAQIAERLCVKPDSVKGMRDRAKQRRAKMSMAAVDGIGTKLNTKFMSINSSLK
jgi:orotate phosphoribosyltransferase-like protein